jgi:hypothetical protein
MSDVNIPLLRKAVEWAEAEAAKPWEVSEWNQADWVAHPKKLWHQTRDALGRFIRGGERKTKAEDCGTCFCIAGKVAYDVGAVPINYNSGFLNGLMMLDGREEWADQIAQKELGLTDKDAANLFKATNKIEDIRKIAENIAGERL